MRLIERYLTIQGEGLRSGKLAYFVRFAECNLRCVWCDSGYTFGPGEEIKFEQVAEDILKSSARWVCLTGGEPLLQEKDCIRLIQHFKELHFDIETGGSLDIQPVQFSNSSVIMDWKLKGSGMNRKMKPENLFLLRPGQDLLKFVTDMSEEETEEIQKWIEHTEATGVPVSVQPVYPVENGTEPPLQKLTEWVIALGNPRVQVNLQMHKHIWGKQRSGV